MRQPFTAILLLALTLAVLASPIHADQEPTPHSIIDRALNAGGGAEKISQFKAVSFKGELELAGEKSKFSGQFAAPSLCRIEFEGDDKGPTVFVGGGDTFWVKEGGDGFKEYHKGGEKSDFVRLAPLFFAVGLPDQILALKGKDYKLTILGDQGVMGVPAVAMRVNHELHPEALIYFDKETGLPVKSELKIPQFEGKNAILFRRPTDLVEIFFDNYKEIDGVQHFTKFTLRMGDESIACEIREIKLLKKFDSGTFKKPK